jgi:nucleoside-diphosphate-sugar epimerase
MSEKKIMSKKGRRPLNRILITGGAGFIGSHIARRLAERGNEVVLYDVLRPTNECEWLLKPFEDKIKYEFGSVDNPTALFIAIKKHDIEKIVHAATIVNPPLLQEQPLLAFRIKCWRIAICS